MLDLMDFCRNREMQTHEQEQDMKALGLAFKQKCWILQQLEERKNNPYTDNLS
jgi:hypothetical protein